MPAAGELVIPEGVREVVGRRLSRLSAAGAQALTAAAVIGVEVELPVLQAVVDLDEDTLLAAIDEAIAAGFIDEKPGPAPRYGFSHTLVRSAIYGELTSARLLRLHRRVGEAIERFDAERIDERIPELALHFGRAAGTGGVDKAVDYITKAGDRALAQLAHDEAVSYYREALELTERRLPGDDSADASGSACSSSWATPSDGPATQVTGRRCSAWPRAPGGWRNPTSWPGPRSPTTARSFATVGEVDDERTAMLEAAIEAVGPDDSEVRARLLAHLGVELMFSGEVERRERLAPRPSPSPAGSGTRPPWPMS